jgi:uncharacterized membrane protein
MPAPADARRRWFGLFFLLIAGGMLIWGLTVLAGSLKGMAFVIYWLVCFAFTGLALLIALLDLFVVRHRQREEQRDLIVKSIEEFEAKKKEKSQSSKSARKLK